MCFSPLGCANLCQCGGANAVQHDRFSSMRSAATAIQLSIQGVAARHKGSLDSSISTHSSADPSASVAPDVQSSR